MPLRVRFTADVREGAEALRWLADGLALARLFNARETTYPTEHGLVVDLVFTGSGEREFPATIKPFTDYPLGTGFVIEFLKEVESPRA